MARTRMTLAVPAHDGVLQPVGDGWYRFHSLFRDVLRLKLRRERPDIVTSLHGKAARWYQQQGMLAEAVRRVTVWGITQLPRRIRRFGRAPHPQQLRERSQSVVPTTD